MTVRHWTRSQALSLTSPSDLDDLLDADLLVVDDIDGAERERLGWMRHAPCVVAVVDDDETGPDTADVIVTGAELERLVHVVEANPRAARTLVDVLRTVEGIPITTGVIVESLAYSMLLGGAEFITWLQANPRRPSKRFDRPPVRLERDDSVLRIILDRPENRNAHSAQMRDALCDALDVADRDATIRTVVLSAIGPVFSSGGDLAEFGTAEDLVQAHQIRVLRGVGARIAVLGAQTIVHVKGDCVGAGVEIPAFADRVVAAPDATFRLPEIGMGLIPGAGGTVSLARRIGRQRTARLALLGQPISATRARRWGLVDAIE